MTRSFPIAMRVQRKSLCAFLCRTCCIVTSIVNLAILCLIVALLPKLPPMPEPNATDAAAAPPFASAIVEFASHAQRSVAVHLLADEPTAYAMAAPHFYGSASIGAVPSFTTVTPGPGLCIFMAFIFSMATMFAATGMVSFLFFTVPLHGTQFLLTCAHVDSPHVATSHISLP